MEETRENSGLGLMLTVGILAGLAMMVGPWLVPAFDPIARGGVAGFGLLVFGLSTVFAGIAKLYVRTKPDEAFVRTGMNGQRVVIDGGTMVVPVFHQIKRIPLRTLKLEVERKGTEALITSDFLRVDIRAAFFVRVAKDVESIQTAASTLHTWTTTSA